MTDKRILFWLIVSVWLIMSLVGVFVIALVVLNAAGAV